MGVAVGNKDIAPPDWGADKLLVYDVESDTPCGISTNGLAMALAAILVLCLLVVLICCLRRRGKHKMLSESETPPSVDEPEVQLPLINPQFDPASKLNKVGGFLDMLRTIRVVHGISTPWGGDGAPLPNRAGAARARRQKRELEDLMDSIAVFDPNQDLAKMRNRAHITATEQSQLWLWLWTEVLKVSTAKKGQGSKVFVMKHKTGGILGHAQYGEINIATIAGFVEGANLIYVEFDDNDIAP